MATAHLDIPFTKNALYREILLLGNCAKTFNLFFKVSSRQIAKKLFPFFQFGTEFVAYPPVKAVCSPVYRRLFAALRGQTTNGQLANNRTGTDYENWISRLQAISVLIK